MGLINFQRPVGAKADLEELLYVSALHQTSFNTRQHGTILAEDIKHYLISRHGIEVSSETVADVILSGFGIGCGTIDIVEIVQMLFIPHLREIAAASLESNNGESTDDIPKDCSIEIIESILGMILHDTTGDKKPKELTLELVKNICSKYHEDCTDDLAREMLEAAKGADGHSFLNMESFICALSSDIKCYKTRNESKELSTTLRRVFEDEITNGCTYPVGKASAREDDLPVVFQDENDSLVQDGKSQGDSGHSFTKVKTAKGIDYTAGTYSSKNDVILLWVCFVFGSAGYIFPLATDLTKRFQRQCPDYLALADWNENMPPFGCDIETSILRSIITFLLMTIMGFTWILLDSYRLSIQTNHPWILASTLALLVATLVIVIIFIPFDTNFWPVFYLQIITVSLAGLLLLKGIIAQFKLFNSRAFKSAFVSRALIDESYSQEAAFTKIKLLQENARFVLSDIAEGSAIKTYFGQGVFNFTIFEDKFESTGGIMWTIKRFWNKELYYREGIWFPIRILVTSIAQMINSSVVLVIGIYFTVNISNNWKSSTEIDTIVLDSLNSILTTIADQGIIQNTANKLVNSAFGYTMNVLMAFDSAGILQFDCFALGSHLMNTCVDKASNVTDFACDLFAVGHEQICEALEILYRPLNGAVRMGEVLSVEPVINTTVLREPIVALVESAVSDNFVLTMNYLYPQARYMVVVPAIIATIVAFMVSASLSFIVVPSITSSILKLRSGLIPTMKKKNFSDYYYNVINITKLTGALFWGNLVASIALGLVIGFLIFLSLWQVSVFLVQRIIAVLIGVYIIVIVTWFVIRSYKKSAFVGFYRVKPFSANIFSLFNECLNMGLTIFLALTRLLFLLVCSMFFVGRFDVPFLAPQIGVLFGGWIDLDPYYNWFIAGILSVEAHRHPYIETLGGMYLMKLKHSDRFISPAGIKWRVIFVTALMPWLNKYRAKCINAQKERMLTSSE